MPFRPPRKSFSRQLTEWVIDVNKRFAVCEAGIKAHVFHSVVNGSPVTGAPGQPVDSGVLIMSWKRSDGIPLQPPSAVAAATKSMAGKKNHRFTDVMIFSDPLNFVDKGEGYYAPVVEHNLYNYNLRSPVGGFHSVKLTVSNADRIFAAELEKAKALVPDKDYSK